MVGRFLTEEDGQDVIEYSLLLVLLGAVAVLILTGMGQSIGAIFSKIQTKIEQAGSTMGE